jgi:ribosomal protein S18 acetylase RimI-like enzyme
MSASEAEAAVTLRAAGSEDAAEMVRIHHASVRAIPRKFYPHTVLAAWSPEPDARRQQWMRGLIGSGRYLALLAERDGEAAGFALCEASEGFLQALYVDPQRAGGGVGRSLLRACEQAMCVAGKARARVLASHNAVPFYRAAGYRELGAASQPLADGSLLACVEMSRALPAPG